MQGLRPCPSPPASAPPSPGPRPAPAVGVDRSRLTAYLVAAAADLPSVPRGAITFHFDATPQLDLEGGGRVVTVTSTQQRWVAGRPWCVGAWRRTRLDRAALSPGRLTPAAAPLLPHTPRVAGATAASRRR
jgi:hypothetical protein